MPKKSSAAKRTVETHTHTEAARKNIPTAEYQAMLDKAAQAPVRVAYERRNRDLDPQLVWRGKDVVDWSDLIVHAAPLYIQEKVQPKVLIDDLLRRSQADAKTAAAQLDLFADFNGLLDESAKTEFYQHDAHWANRMILGDSLQVMASLAEREGLRGKVQCIYLDPPYGIKFNSNFQWSTTSRDVKDGNAAHITREPEQVKAFRDTWRDGIHSYLTYLRDRLTVARDLLADSGSIFVQIGDENVHRVRALMDEVFGDENFISAITANKAASQSSTLLASVNDFILWYAKDITHVKYRQIYNERPPIDDPSFRYICVETPDGRLIDLSFAQKSGKAPIPEGEFLRLISTTSQTGSETSRFAYEYGGKSFRPPGSRGWSTSRDGLDKLSRAGRLASFGNTLAYKRYHRDSSTTPVTSLWADVRSGGFQDEKVYVVQTASGIVGRCILMATDPGDLVLDPTCGSGTTAYVSEQWGRRWITIDTSRVALALARARLMGARYPYYLLKDSREGHLKEAEVTRTMPSSQPVYGNIRQGFVYERVPHITLKSIANNAEIDVIWDKWQAVLEPLREKLNVALKKDWQEWEIPRELPVETQHVASLHVASLHAEWWGARIERQKEIDASIAAKAEFEDLYDKPYPDNKKVRVAGPFTVESLSPHRTLGVDENGELIDSAAGRNQSEVYDFVALILENLKTAGVQQAHKEDKITFTALTPWPGDLVCAEGRYHEGVPPSPSGRGAGGEGSKEKRAAIFIGPEFGTVSRPDLVAAAREAADAGFDVLITCAFNYDAHSTEFAKLGRLPVLKARMNADLHMAEDLKNTGKGNLFVIFGEPDITVVSGQWLVTRDGRLIANYEHVKELSGFGSLEEINRAGRNGLSALRPIPPGGKVRLDQPDQASGSLGSGQHRGGRGAHGDEGVSPIPQHSQRLAGGDRDLSDSGGKAGHGDEGTKQPTSSPGGRRWSDAQRSQTLTALKNLSEADFPLQLTTDHKAQVTVHGVDVFHPNLGEVRSDNADGIACWFIDTDYNEESFFVRHAYFLGANDPYSALKTSLKAEVNAEAWATLNSDTSRPFDKPKSGRIAVKVINHLGDEVMKVFKVS